MRRFFIAIAAGMLLAGMVAGTTAAASRVVVEHRSVAPLLFEGIDSCLADYGFTYTGEYTRTRTITAWLDDEGNTVREVWSVHFDGVETNDSDPTKSLAISGERRLVFDFTANTFTETGALRHVTVAGAGAVLLQVGRSQVPLEGDDFAFEAGPHQMNAGDWDAFCQALA
jgi:hypothetical protein